MKHSFPPFHEHATANLRLSRGRGLSLCTGARSQSHLPVGAKQRNHVCGASKLPRWTLAGVGIAVTERWRHPLPGMKAIEKTTRSLAVGVTGSLCRECHGYTRAFW